MNTTLKRTLSGIVLAAIALSCILLSKYLFGIMMLFVMVVAMNEFHKMTMGNEYVFSRILSIVTGCTLFLLTLATLAFECVTPRFLILSFVPLIAVMVNSLYVRDKSDFGKFANIYTSILYISVPITVSNLLVFHNTEFNGLLFLCFLALTCSSDIGAYFFGMSFGQKYGKKLFPSISPKKSWIGFWGGMFLSIAVAVVLSITGIFKFGILHSIILSVILTVTGVYGDLFESQWKRHYEIKDSGNLIPGHGGMLDRIDSLLFAIPSGTLYLLLFNLI